MLWHHYRYSKHPFNLPVSSALFKFMNWRLNRNIFQKSIAPQTGFGGVVQPDWTFKRFWRDGSAQMKLKIWLEYSEQTPIFEVKLFFQRSLENFLFTLRPCLKYLKCPSWLALYASKKIRAIRHTYQKISAKRAKKKHFRKLPSAPL